ncbi:chromosomal replication initiator protein DnaA [Candidatus Pelagibacter sp.]|nr:chromosomal replication initiator protein DnaA [Candidatus Pelagibacter sp.]MDC3162438.1 chromosomal replication initiator protein DnaA [Candidatus Pelagibacter sp.]
MKNNLSNIESDNIKKLDWKSIQNEMKSNFGNDIYDSWLKKIDLVDELNNYVLISVSTRFIRDWIASRYLDQILKIIKSFKKDISRIEFIISDNNNAKNIEASEEKNLVENEKVSFIKDSYLQYNRIDPNKNFENFLLGKSNKLAFEAAKKVSEQIAYYNPFYVYGGVGMGKTHLLNAIGLSLKDKNKVMFLSAERFMYQFVKSIKSNDMVKFKEYFRNTDIFLIDDIQFMNGKEAMQEEFFHTFNVLLEKGSQVIVSADRPPNKLTRIQERIKSRFSGGLVVDIQNADYDLRYKIVKSKNEDLKMRDPNNIKINEEVIKFISTEVNASIRELVGAFNRIVSFSRIYGKTPSMSEVKVILKDLLCLTENKVDIDNIQTIVCKYFKISKNEMLSPRRSRYLVRPRQTAIYLSKMLTSKSLPEIGRYFANRDHTTVIHSVKTIEKLKKVDNELSLSIDSLKNKILYKQENEI